MRAGVFVRGLAAALLALLLASCAAQVTSLTREGFVVGEVTVQGVGAQAGRGGAAEICRGPILSEQQVRAFLAHAAYVPSADAGEGFSRLPCYAYGAARIDGKRYQWKIRAGGVGEFVADDTRFVKVCGRHCCDKVQGIC